MNNVGILTFHCADNYGALLQAYGLKCYLEKQGTGGEIVCYEPFFMTGRHWWIPYVPIGNIVRRLGWSLYGWRANVKKGTLFFQKRANMKKFRKRYLIKKGQRKLYFTYQLRRLPYEYYIVGSDQIWNPDITCGLKKAYFGAFYNRNKRKVIAYGASLGRASLSEEYDKEFSELLTYVDAVSVREKSAITYIQQFYTGEILEVPDPVFLLEKKEWQRIEKLPEQEGYIVVCAVEKNRKLYDYAKDLAKSRGLSIIEITSGTEIAEESIGMDYTAGPSEVLGYIHKADYIITSSFHMIAFSIIYQKKFAAFQYNHAGERISNILRDYGMEDRLYQENREMRIDDEIDWSRVEEQIKKNVSLAKDFLWKHVGC